MKSLTINIDHVAKHLKKDLSFRELDHAIKKGHRIQDIILVVPSGVVHSGSFPTAYGQLRVVTVRKRRKACLMLMSEMDYELAADYL